MNPEEKDKPVITYGERYPYFERCRYCGTKIQMGHLAERCVDGKRSGEEVVDHEISIPQPCPYSEDGRHTVTGL
jgi:hypothetical protein